MALSVVKDNDQLDNEKQIPFMLFKIQPYHSSPLSSKSAQEHLRTIRKNLTFVLPQGFSFANTKDFLDWSKSNLPLITWTECERLPDCFSIYLFCQPLAGLKTESFFWDLIKRWLNPEKELSILSFQQMQFHLQGIEQELFFLAEAKVFVETGHDLDKIKSHLPIFAEEVRSGLKSRLYAKYLLEHKTLPLDQQIAYIHKDIVKLVENYGKDIDKNIFYEINRFLALTHISFREYRLYRHLSRVVFYFSYTRKMIRNAMSSEPEKRHISIRFLPTRLQFTFGTKPVLGIVLSIFLFDKYEFFEEEHIITAVQKYIPNAQVVAGSFHIHKNPDDPITSIYLELEKTDGLKFFQSDLQILKIYLADDLKGRVEKLISSVFRIRNEEEVMKNIFLLSQELKAIHDLPQVIISFEEQSNIGLIFTVVLVRVLRMYEDPLEKLLQKADCSIQYVIERSQVIGYIRKKFPKEANVFRLQIPKDPAFLRGNSSLNFYLARQKVVSILNQTIGEIRDYNGGMILKKAELFSQFKQAFHYVSEKHQTLLENFFYSINPIERQATLPLTTLSKLFKLFVDGIEEVLPEKEHFVLKIHEEKDAIYVLVAARESSFKEDVAKILNKFRASRESMTTTELYFNGAFFAGYIFNCQDAHKQMHFCLAIQEGMHAWLHRIKSMQILNLCCINLPISLDPRIAGDELSGTIIRMLFDGLMRIGFGGKLEYAIAESVQISEDLKTYTFTLRESFWSNGAKIIAYDFEYSWKKMLSPDFSTPFAYFLYPIKNAQATKEGLVSVDQVGIHVINDQTLEVHLESPTPYFLELTAYSFLYPVNHLIDQIHPNWAIQKDDSYICNGPFRLKKATTLNGFELAKNTHYWDVKSVQLDKITILKTNAHTASEMFKKNEHDWLGMPIMHPWEPFFSQDLKESVTLGPFRGIYWFVFNVQRFPFHNEKIRKALTFAINRQAIIKELNYEEGRPALTPLPLIHTQISDEKISDGDEITAKRLFEEGLQELHITLEHFPILTLMHGNGELRRKIAQIIQRQWHKALGIQVRLESYEWTDLFNKVVQGDYEISGMGWFPRINDPIYTLNAFKHRNNKINFSKWENSEFQQLLNAADHEIDPLKRYQYIAEAEKLLLKDMPFAPIFYEQQLYIKKRRLKDVFHSEVGNVDFKWAYIEKD